MPRLKNKLPVPRLNRPSGRARLRLNGRDVWLGKFGSPEAQAAYDRIVSEWLANGRSLPPAPSQVSETVPETVSETVPVTREETKPPDPVASITIADLVDTFNAW